MIERLKKILRSLYLFSALVIRRPLRAYQLAPARAVIESCLKNQGLEFLWIFPRQSGKDEAVAQLCAYLLTLFHRTEVGIVHTYPTSGQLPTGVSRLEHRLDNFCTGGRWWRKSKPIRRGFGLAQISFLSGHRQAKSEGTTASLLLIVNETQDHSEAVVSRRFEPMRASTNATMLYVGTVRTTNDYLWRVKQRLERLEQQDGIRRVFLVGPDEVGQENPLYARFVENQLRLKGRHHPSVKTELFNEPVDVAAGFFPERRRALMLGTHTRLRGPVAGEVYLAVIDVGGVEERGTEGIEGIKGTEGIKGFEGVEGGQGRDRDYTVCTIVRVKREASMIGPGYEVVDVMVEQGTRHFQELPGKPSLFSKTLAYLKHWNANAVICDQTGLGQGFTDALKGAYRRPVFGFTFSGPSKARLGNDFLAVIETGRFRYFKDGYTEEGSDAWWFFTQCEFCGYELAGGLPIERGLRWGVSPAAKVTVSDVVTVPVHDDRLVSAALVAEADRLYRAGELFLMTGESAVIRRDVMREIDQGGWKDGE